MNRITAQRSSSVRTSSKAGMAVPSMPWVIHQ